MAVRAGISVAFTAIESVPTNATPFISSTQLGVQVYGLDESLTLTATSTPPVTKLGFGVITLTAGAATVDMTSLVGLNGVAISLSGLKPIAIKFQNPSTNANNMTIAKGASNGYTGFGSSFSITIPPGGSVVVYMNTAIANPFTAVSGSVKTLDITGTGAQVLNYEVLGGT